MTRKKGTGSIYQLPNGYWRGSVDLPAPSGKRIRKTVGATTQDAAEAKLDALVAGVRLPANLGELRGVQAAAWAEGALWAAVECGAINAEDVGWLVAGDNPYRN